MNVLVAGATGFVGTHLVRELERSGHHVRRGTRDPARASAKHGEADWVRLDVDDRDSLCSAMADIDAFVLLVHRMQAGVDDLEAAERRCADNVAACAEQAGVRRIVYLGGPIPEGDVESEHLRARALTGEILRSGKTPVIELRAGMIVGHGSESWTIVRDLAFRLPAMVLPAWLETKSQPIAIGDVTTALRQAVEAEEDVDGAWDLPGPEVLSAWDVLERIAAHRGMRPIAVRVPLLTPSLSSHWIRLVTRADYNIARHLVEGLTNDLVCADDGWWARFPAHQRTGFDQAVLDALTDEPELIGWGSRWERLAQSLAVPVREPRRLAGSV